MPKQQKQQNQKRPRCPTTRRSNAGVLPVCDLPRGSLGGQQFHGPCLVVFYNNSAGRDWECPFGQYDMDR